MNKLCLCSATSHNESMNIAISVYKNSFDETIITLFWYYFEDQFDGILKELTYKKQIDNTERQTFDTFLRKVFELYGMDTP